MLTPTQLAEMSPRPGASPGLMRRRYSVPETIMRKYRLAQQRSEYEESEPPTDRSPVSASPSGARGSCNSLCDAPAGPGPGLGQGGLGAHRCARRDREVMRKSALLRRMWGRPHPGVAWCQCGGDCDRPCRQPRSLDGSRCELRLSACRPLPSPPGTSSPVGWATAERRRRLGASPTDFRGSDETLPVPEPGGGYDRTGEYGSHRPAEPSTQSTFRSHGRIETSTGAFTDSDASKLDDGSDANGSIRFDDGVSSDAATVEIKSGTPADGDDYLGLVLSAAEESSSVDTCPPAAPCGALRPYGRPPPTAHIDGRISERSMSVENEDDNVLPYDRPLTIDTPSYEVLEIVVSETSSTNVLPPIRANVPEKCSSRPLKASVPSHRNVQNINIDEYVSNILVESLNSLTDQLECMNASIGSDRKISIVEKEIKVKLQNTGVNTIVHLSPTSNNQIIFGNEELYNSDENKNSSGVPQDGLTIREEMHSLESNNNPPGASPSPSASPSAAPLRADSFGNIVQHDNVNQAVLQQIQKLFQDELHNLNSEIDYPGNAMPGISHIEISNVDVYIGNNSDGNLVSDEIEMRTQRQRLDTVEAIGSVGAGNYFQDEDETAVVPRFSAFPHTDSMEVNTSSSDDGEPLGSGCASLVDSLDDPNSPRSVLLRRSFDNRRAELVRSAIDVLDLLPESAYKSQNSHYTDKGESFFIRMKDNDYDCEKENINVADHMPENIKQRLYKRQRKRELRMECARRSKVKQMKRELERQRYADICKSRREIEKDCMAIINALIDDVIAKIAQDEYKCMRIKQRPNRPMAAKSDENISKNLITDPFKITKNGTVQFNSRDGERRSLRDGNHQIHGKLSLLTRPTLTSDGSDKGPRRIYQKSEIHDGNKCIEILEILEYVNGTPSSPETTNSDDNHDSGSRSRKSRIPIPIHERTYPRTPKDGRAGDAGDDGACSPAVTSPAAPAAPAAEPGPARRASVPHGEPPARSRSNSLRFKRVFDIIPEERSSLSVDSPGEERRAAAGTHRSAATMTSPGSKSAATSPAEGRRRAWPPPAGRPPLCAVCAPPAPPCLHRTARSVSVE